MKDTLLNQTAYKIINEADEEVSEIKWRVQVQKAVSDVDDSFDDDSGLDEFIVAADDFDEAVKLASQYVLMQAREDTTWTDAVIISVVKQQ